MAEWSEQFSNWYKGQKTYTSLDQIANEVKMSRSALTRCMKGYGKWKDVDHLSKGQRVCLYKITQIDNLKFEGIENYESPPEETQNTNTPLTPKRKAKAPSSAPDKIKILTSLGKVEHELRGIRTALAALSAEEFQEYSTQQHAEHVGSLLEELAESLEPFRTGKDEERQILITHLRKYGDTFAYITQMIKTLEDPSPQNWFLKQITPPHFLKKIKGENYG